MVLLSKENEGERCCGRHPDCMMLTDFAEHPPKEYCPRCKAEKADNVIEETIKEEAPPEKPQLNASRIHQFGTYRLFYDIKVVDEKKGIWQGRPVPEADMGKIPQAADMEKSWVLFTRNYDPEINQWDMVYPEYEITDAKMFGQKILIVPKEKILFSYNPPPGSGILIPASGVVRGN